MEFAYRRQTFVILFFCFAAWLPLLPIFTNHLVPDHPDYLNHLALIIQAKLALAEGQFPLRIAPLDFPGSLYPYFQFYSPTTYTVAGLIYQWLTPSQPFLAFKIMIWLALCSGGIYIYKLAYWFVQSRSIALLSGLFYLTSPYVFVLVCGRGGFNEAIALGITPSVMYYVLKQYSTIHLKYFSKAVLAWFLLATVHIVTFFYTSFCIALLLLLRFKNWKQVKWIAAAYLFSCLLAMWYLAPIVLLEKYLYINYTFHYIQIPYFTNLFSPAFTHGFPTAKDPAIGWPMLGAVCVCIIGYFKKSIFNGMRSTEWLPAFLGTYCIIFFLIFMPIWQWLPHFFLVGQFSVRLLVQLTLIGTVLFAWTISWILKNETSLRMMCAIAFVFMIGQIIWVGIVLFSLVAFILLKQKMETKKSVALTLVMLTAISSVCFLVPRSSVYNILNRDSYVWLFDKKKIDFSSVLEKPRLGYSIKDYLIFPNKQYLLSDINTLHIDQTSQRCQVYKEIVTCKLMTDGNSHLIELPVLYYPYLLHITLNGKTVPYQGIFNKGKGYVLTTITSQEKKENDIKVQFTGLQWANWISLLALGCYLFVCSVATLKKSLSSMRKRG